MFSHSSEAKTSPGHGGAHADPAGPWKRAHEAEPVRSGGPRAASPGVPRRPEERPGGRVAPLELRLRLGEAAGGRRLPVGGRVRGPGARPVPLLRVGGERERPSNPREIQSGAAGRGENTREESGAEEETDQYHRFLPGEEEAGGHAPQIRTVTQTRAWTHNLIRVKTHELSRSSAFLHRHLPSAFQELCSKRPRTLPSCVIQEHPL